MSETMYHSILLIEEEKDPQNFIGKIFVHFPAIRLHTVNDPYLAVDAVKTIRPELIIAEINYPFLGGYIGKIFFGAVRKEVPNVKIIIASTLSQEEIQAEFLSEIKVQCYLKKPYDLEFLLRRSCELLDIPCG